MTKRRVLWLLKGLGLGGAERLVTSALPHFDRQTFAYHVGYFLPHKNALVQEIQDSGIPVTCFASRCGLPGVALRLRSFLRSERIDVLHAHLPWAGILGRLTARSAQVPCIVYTEHGCWERLHPATRWLNRRTLGWDDVTIAVSDEVRRSMGAPRADQMRTILNGIDVRGLRATADERGAVCGELGVSPEDLLIICVANLTAVKNHELLINAFAQLVRRAPACTLLLVGQLREREPAIRQQIASLGLTDRVRLTGPRQDVPRLVKAADVFALSSRSEGLPISLLEAMALSKPVVCTRVGGIPEVVREGQEGFLVPVDDVNALADRLQRLTADPQLRASLGERALRRVAEHYDIAVMVRAVEAEYLACLARQAGDGRRTKTLREPTAELAEPLRTSTP